MKHTNFEFIHIKNTAWVTGERGCRVRFDTCPSTICTSLERYHLKSKLTHSSLSLAHLLCSTELHLFQERKEEKKKFSF